MARPIYAHELSDPDFAWLLSSFREQHPEYIMVEGNCLPVSLIREVTPVRVGVPMQNEAEDLDTAEPE
ncbi:MAG: hypothetical protein QY326_04860 [Bdellovibrionota bacterium]|nr:MAG: hypothetical protein QY326_04860 [Bdellovibrionota bacterium]